MFYLVLAGSAQRSAVPAGIVLLSDLQSLAQMHDADAVLSQSYSSSPYNRSSNI